MVSFDDFTLVDGRPIYLQIIQYIKRGIAAGRSDCREEMPSRRVLSALLGVNPNTVQKAYKLLEDEGIIVSRSGAKSYICIQEEMVERVRRELLAGETKCWVEAMRQLKVSREMAFEMAKEFWKNPPD